MDDIESVWVEDTCIGCHACVGSAPEVFSLPGSIALVLGEVRVDGRTSQNVSEHSPLNAVGLECSDAIHEAIAGCPVEAICFRRVEPTTVHPPVRLL